MRAVTSLAVFLVLYFTLSFWFGKIKLLLSYFGGEILKDSFPAIVVGSPNLAALVILLMFSAASYGIALMSWSWGRFTLFALTAFLFLFLILYLSFYPWTGFVEDLQLRGESAGGGGG